MRQQHREVVAWVHTVEACFNIIRQDVVLDPPGNSEGGESRAEQDPPEMSVTDWLAVWATDQGLQVLNTVATDLLIVPFCY